MQPESSEALGQRSTRVDQMEAGHAPRLHLERGEPESEQQPTSPDLLEFAGAFAVGALVGAGVMLLMRPRRRRGTERLRHDLAPYGKKMRESAQTARRNFAAGADATSAAAEALGQASRTLIMGLREEVGEIIGSARDEFSQSINDQVGQALKTIRRGYRRKGWR